MRKNLHRIAAPSLFVTLVFCVASGCNPTPPRKPATTKKADPSVPGANTASSSPGSIFNQGETPGPSSQGEFDANGNPISPRQSQSPAPEASASASPPPSGGSVPGSTPAQPASSPAAASSSPSSSTVPTGVGASQSPPPDPVITTGPQGAPTLLYRTYFKPAEPDVPNKRQGSWNFNCLSLKNEAGTLVESSICNKKISNSCYVYHESNNGIQKSVTSSLIDNGLEIRLAITTGASYCADGQKIPSTDARKDSLGFIYLNGSNVKIEPEVVSSTSNSSLERFKCAKKAVTGGFKYKICIEDAQASYNSDAQIWDFNDFVLILESSKDLAIAGVNCVDNGPALNLPDSTCK